MRLIGVVGAKRELRVFERSKLLPFGLGIKAGRNRQDDETEWCAAGPRGQGPALGSDPSS